MREMWLLNDRYGEKTALNAIGGMGIRATRKNRSIDTDKEDEEE